MRASATFAVGVLLGLTSGAVLSASSVLTAGGTHETLVVAAGDSLLPAFATNTDPTLFAYGNGKVIIKRCGVGSLYLRTWRKGKQASADTITLLCPSPLATMKTACDSAMYAAHNQTYPDTSIDPAQLPDAVKQACKLP